MSYGIIYVTRCLVTGKLYVGMHTKGRKNYLGSGQLILKAIKKYGCHNFVRHDIDEFYTISEGGEKERLWIRKFNSKIPHGYNLCDGGEGVFNPCQEVRNRISAANSHPLSEEHKRHLSAAHRGLPSPRKGKFGAHLSEEHKAKLLAANLGRHRNEATKLKISLANKGRKRTDDQKEHIGASRRGKPWSPARRQAQELRKENYNFVSAH